MERTAMSAPVSRELLLLARTAPPNVCGVGDYNAHLARELGPRYTRVSVGLGQFPGGAQPAGAFGVAASLRGLTARLKTSAGSADVLVHYTPTSFSRWGNPQALVAGLKKLRRRFPAVRIFLLVHETGAVADRARFHHRLRGAIFQWGLWKLGQLASGLAVVTEDQAATLRKNYRNVTVVPVGSNILPSDPELGFRGPRNRDEAVVFGLGHSRLWALQAHTELLRKLRAQGHLRQLISIGPEGDASARSEAALGTELLGRGGLRQRGSLTAPEISNLLASAAWGLGRFTPDSWNKSGTFMAFAAHGTPIVCAAADPRSSAPAAFLFHPDEVASDSTVGESSEGVRRRRALQAWYQANHSWRQIGLRIAEWMESAA
jgi:hypothetical protein